MKLSHFQKTALGIAGITASAIGLFILIMPHAFYASYGITLAKDPNLLSELRAPGAGLAVLGGMMLAGLIRMEWVPVAVATSLAVYVAFPVGRIVSLIADGMPSENVLGALLLEIVIAAMCIMAFKNKPSKGGVSAAT